MNKVFAMYAKTNLVRMIKKYCKIRNHCHYTGKYKGAAHKVTVLRYK